MNLFDMFESLEKGEIRETYIRAPFGYPGGKSRSVKKILPLLPYRKAYIEAFGGAASILLARDKSKLEVYNDRFGGVVAFYRCIRDKEKMNKLIERLKIVPGHSREEFIWCKETWKNIEEDVERAARWYYMHQISFGNNGRTFGRRTTETLTNKGICNLTNFPKIHRRFKHVLVENQDWYQILLDFDNEDAVFYLDPPYYGTCPSAYRHHFTEKDHIRLCDKVMEMDGFVALSGYENEIYESYDWDEKYQWETRVSITAQAYTSTNNQTPGNRKTKAIETLYIKE